MEGKTQWFGRLFVVVALTFAAAYYVPLYRTHKALVADYTSLAERVTAVEKDLARTRADLGAAVANNQELSLRHQKEDVGSRERSPRIQAELSSKLAPLIAKQELSVGHGADRVRITLPDALKQIQNRFEVTSAGQSALCAVATAVSGTRTITVVAELGEAKTGPGAPSAREVAAARAGAAARTLEQKCRYPSARIATMTRPGTGNAASTGADIDLEIDSAER